MMRIGVLLGISLGLLAWGARPPQANPTKGAEPNTPKYTADGRLMFPENYREWVYLTSGIDMSYSPKRRHGPLHVRQCVREPRGVQGFFGDGHVAG